MIGFQELFLFCFWPYCPDVGSQFPDQALKSCPLHWKRGVLATGLPGKSQDVRTFERWEQRNLAMAMKEDSFPSTTADFPSTTKALLSSCVSQEMKFDKRAIS